jgi:uncharacterized protein YbjT (DUF2867 family)
MDQRQMAMGKLVSGRHGEVMTTNEAPPADRSATDPRPVLVIGATGKTGRRVVTALGTAGQPVRPASRTSPTRFDWTEPDTWGPALAGARAAYVVAPEIPADVEGFLTEAGSAGLERLVLLSARHPDQGGDGMVPAVEAAVRSGPLPATVLQPAWFTQNFTEGMFVDELAGGVLRLPVGDGREPFIDTGDIAEVAAAVLMADHHDEGTFELSGPEALTFDEAIRRLARATGRPLRFEPIEPGAWADGASAFLPPPVVDLLLNLFEAIRDGANDHLSPGVEQVLGRPARSFDEALSADADAEANA